VAAEIKLRESAVQMPFSAMLIGAAHVTPPCRPGFGCRRIRSEQCFANLDARSLPRALQDCGEPAGGCCPNWTAPGDPGAAGTPTGGAEPLPGGYAAVTVLSRVCGVISPGRRPPRFVIGPSLAPAADARGFLLQRR
jgi:hypothetical protein